MVGRYPRTVTHIRIGTILAASPEAVWADVSQIASHVDWMADAIAIRFTSLTTAGVGTTFECKTKIGPFKLTDVMEITEWEPAQVMGGGRDVSRSGAYFITSDEVRLEVCFESNGREVRAPAKIIRVEQVSPGTYGIAVQFERRLHDHELP